VIWVLKVLLVYKVLKEQMVQWGPKVHKVHKV
jgi:hypothetical protein